ncbi:hypothetical protein DPMN_023000 [Dreissena polymorpha]|uniref:Uncharacterized protein n=1 Tax=Dreissena polymorpha TaxID=45954 RepID=A0A9D4LJX2_DREPO|nr:hypothetical protein DPMN_023000 [Dreissena polymorpha]
MNQSVTPDINRVKAHSYRPCLWVATFKTGERRNTTEQNRNGSRVVGLHLALMKWSSRTSNKLLRLLCETMAHAASPKMVQTDRLQTGYRRAVKTCTLHNMTMHVRHYLDVTTEMRIQQSHGHASPKSVVLYNGDQVTNNHMTVKVFIGCSLHNRQECGV